MRRFTIYLMFMLSATWAFGQSGSITGTVTDAETGDPLIGANAVISGTTKGMATDANGKYTIGNLEDGTYTVMVSFVGYDDVSGSTTVSGGQIATLNFTMSGSTVLSDIVISGGRSPEKLVESPATIEVISAADISNIATFNPGELLAHVKGVDFIRSGASVTGLNIRGYNNNFNHKNLEMTDGRLSSLVATGLPLGPLNTVNKEDIERIEVVLGPNSALYGPNAHNGLVQTITKSPKNHQGTIVALGAGNQNMMSARIWHGQELNDHFAYKVVLGYTAIEEFNYSDSVYIDRMDDSGNLTPDGIKEGYEEVGLNNSNNFFKGSADLYYTFDTGQELIFSTGHSNSNYLAPTNVGRNQIRDWQVGYYQLRYNSNHWFAQAYYTTSKTDSTYSHDDRTKQYYRGIDAGMTHEEALAQSYDGGALFRDNSNRINGELQYRNEWGGLNMIVGAQFQRDNANSLNTYLIQEDENDVISVNQFGGYGQARYKFADDKFEGLFAFRADNHEIYGFNFVPKVGFLFHQPNSTWRITYGQGIAAPTIFNQFADLFGGLILGNGEGFTLVDGTVIDKQRIEKLQTIELGYKGQVIPKKLFLDANAYYNISTDFLSPVTIVGVTTHRGDVPIDQVQSLYAVYGGLVATYINFGNFDTYGADFGINYYFNDKFSTTLNYSYFGYNIDENDLDNDFNGDGKVDKLDLLVNAPNNKASLGFNYLGSKFFGNIFFRWVEAYDYFSSYQIAAKTQDLVYRGTPVVENARSTDSWNYGPLGGFVQTDIGIGYHFNDYFTASGQVTNLFDAEVREFTASPFIGRLFSVELKVTLPKYGGN